MTVLLKMRKLIWMKAVRKNKAKSLLKIGGFFVHIIGSAKSF